MNNIIIKQFKNKETLFNSVADRCEQQLIKALKQSNSASFIIPGGTTPAPAFKQLSKSGLDWSKVTIAQSDERWIPAEHKQSNQGLTKKTLLINNAKNAQYTAMKNTQQTAVMGEEICNRDYKNLASPFSLTMLGMGLDGHMASLFPNSKTITQALDLANKNLCIAIDGTGCPVAGDYPERMSLTLSALLKSELIILLITGKEKMNVVELAMKSNQIEKLPISGLLNQKLVPVEIYYCE